MPNFNSLAGFLWWVVALELFWVELRWVLTKVVEVLKVFKVISLLKVIREVKRPRYLNFNFSKLFEFFIYLLKMLKSLKSLKVLKVYILHYVHWVHKVLQVLIFFKVLKVLIFFKVLKVLIFFKVLKVLKDKIDQIYQSYQIDQIYLQNWSKWSTGLISIVSKPFKFCHTRLHLGFSALLKIGQVQSCKVEPWSGIIMLPDTHPPTTSLSFLSLCAVSPP